MPETKRQQGEGKLPAASSTSTVSSRDVIAALPHNEMCALQQSLRVMFHMPYALLGAAVEVADMDVSVWLHGKKQRAASLPICLLGHAQHSTLAPPVARIAFTLRCPAHKAIAVTIRAETAGGIRFVDGDEDNRASHALTTAAEVGTQDRYIMEVPELPADILAMPVLEYRYTTLVGNYEATKVATIPWELLAA